MRRRATQRTVALILSLSVWVIATPRAVLAVDIFPNDDTYVDQTAPDAIRDFPPSPATSSTGILVKGQAGNQRIGFIEFDLPDVTVTSAILNIYHFRSWTAGSPANDWILRIAGRPDSFDETQVTWNNTADTLRTGQWTVLGDLTMPGGLNGQDVNQRRTINITDFFNANKGNTVVFRFTNPQNSGSLGGTLEDREGSRTGNPANVTFITYTTEPVENMPPTAALSACPLEGRAPLTVSFDASGSSDFDGTIIAYHWDFDGDAVIDETTDTPIVQYVYESAGVFNAIVTVEDNDNALTPSEPVVITIEAGPPILTPVTEMLPTGGPLTGDQILTSITAGGHTFTSLIGPPDVTHVEIEGFTGTPENLVGLNLNSAALGLPTTPGSAIRAYFDRPIAADGTDAPEVFVLEWADSRDSFNVELLSNGPGQVPVVIASVAVEACHYFETATIVDPPGSGLANQPIGGVAINLDALGVSQIRGAQIPSAGNNPGVDPCVIAATARSCPRPFADADEDGDVDGDDFGAFQACYTGSNPAPGAFDALRCFCFDRDNNGAIDEFDFSAFQPCVTRSEVDLDLDNPPPGCVP